MDETNNESDIKRGLSNRSIFLLGLACLIAVIIVLGIGFTINAVYKNKAENPHVVKAAAILRLPAAKINNKNVLYADYVADLKTLKKFYSAQPEGFSNPTEEQISDQVLGRLLANRLIDEYAGKYKVKVSQEDMERAKKEILGKFSSEEEAKKEINEKFSWTLEQYLLKVGVPLLKEQKLQETFSKSADEANKKYEEEEVRASHILFLVKDGKNDAKVKAQAQGVLSRILKGEDFAELAKQYSEDSTKDEGGNLGWFGKGMMVPEFEQSVFALKAGEVNPELVKTQYGYHIIKAGEKRTTRNFSAFMNDQLKEAKIRIYIPVHNPFEKLTNTTGN